MPEDAQLLARYARDRSEAAFTEFVRGRIDLVYSVARRCVGGDAQRAREVTQDVFLAAARNAEKLSHHPVPAAWLHAATRNAAANLLRAERRRENRNQRAHAMQEIDLAGRRSPEWEQLRGILDGVLYELSDLDRRALVLRFFDNCSNAELGAKLSLHEDAARMRVARALEKLRVRLSKRGITSTSAALTGLLTHGAVEAAPSDLVATVSGAVMSAVPAAPGIFALITMVKIKTLVIAGIVLGLGATAYLDHIKQRAQIRVLERVVSRMEAQLANYHGSRPEGSRTPEKMGDVRKSAATALPLRKNDKIIAADLAKQADRLRAFKNVGLSSPRAALETFAWAAGNGDTEELSKVLALDAASKDTLKALWDSMTPEQRKTFPSLESLPAAMFALEGLIKHAAERAYQIENETDLPSGNVRVDFAVSSGRNWVEKTVEFQNSPTGWQFLVPQELVSRIPILLADPVKLNLLLAGESVTGFPAWTGR